MISLLDQAATLLALDPFTYLVFTIFGIIVWVWLSMVTSLALTGPGVWVRRGSLLVALAAAVLFAYTARTLK
ncbi:MAG: hypothetical protein ACE5I7_09455 [Candidatus Binatia bacterium]